MRYIEISDGLSVSVHSIEAVQKIDDFTSKIHTSNNSYDSHFPYLTMLHILEGEQPVSTSEATMKKLSAVLDKKTEPAW